MSIPFFSSLLDNALLGSRWALEEWQRYRFAGQFGLDQIEETKEKIAIILRSDELKRPNALFLLAYMNQQGIGMKPNFAEAIRLYDEAIGYNHPDAMYHRACLYRYGLGCEVSDLKAALLLDKACELDHSDAMTVRAAMYLYPSYSDAISLDPSHNKKAAISLYQKACRLGNKTAMRALAGIYEKDGKYPLAIELYNRARISRDTISIADCARMYALGYIGKIDYKAAFALFLKSESAFKMAEENGFIRLHWLDNVTDDEHTRKLYDEEYRNAYSSTITDLATMYQEGMGCDVNIDRAIELYDLAIQLGNSNAMHARAYMYHQGVSGIPIDFKAAFRLYEQASLLNNGKAMNNLGIMYEYGLTVPVNYSKALVLYTKSKALGDSRADAGLERLKDKMKKITVGNHISIFSRAAPIIDLSSPTSDTDSTREYSPTGP